MAATNKKPAPWQQGKQHHPQATGGSGYGGSASDKQTRNKGKKEAQKREQGTWASWQAELKDFLEQKKKCGGAAFASADTDTDTDTGTTTDVPILNTLKQVLRCQAPNWWWKQPQRKMYILALEVSIVLTRQHPMAWGDPDDSESAIAALEELAQTCKLLVSSSIQATATGINNIDTSKWLREKLTKTPKHKNTNEKDLTLPRCVLKLQDEASTALKSILETPDCSAIGAHEYYRQKMRPLAFGMIEEGDSFEIPRHFYAPGGGYERTTDGAAYSAKSASSSKRGKKSNGKSHESRAFSSSARVLWKELATYPTALPIEYGSSIFVRVLESELNKLRVLIIGPEDTPYANGCFLFDVTMGSDYPNRPPKVQFLTTSSFLPEHSKSALPSNRPGRSSHRSNAPVRFNPNLYNCGKVCLSLLGTWEGPSWTPKESTLLQVLISLQSLVLGATKPYFNEPGYEASEGTDHGELNSKRYNQDIRRKTLRVAMLPFLHNQLYNCREDNEDKSGPTTSAASVLTPAFARRGAFKAGTGSSKKRKWPKAEKTHKYWFPEFRQVIEQHFKLKKQSIREQLLRWLQEDGGLMDLYSEYWEAFGQLEELGEQPHKHRQRQRQRQKALSVASIPVPCPFETRDGVILLHEEEDDCNGSLQLQQALTNSMGVTGEASTTRDLVGVNNKNGSGVIELLVDSDDEEIEEVRDSDDEEIEEVRDRKPAATATGSRKAFRGNHNEVVDLT